MKKCLPQLWVRLRFILWTQTGQRAPRWQEKLDSPWTASLLQDAGAAVSRKISCAHWGSVTPDIPSSAEAPRAHLTGKLGDPGAKGGALWQRHVGGSGTSEQTPSLLAYTLPEGGCDGTSWVWATGPRYLRCFWEDVGMRLTSVTTE